LTANGNIVVNSVLASCHSNLAAQTLQSTFFSLWKDLNAMAKGVRHLFTYVPHLLFNDRIDGSEKLIDEPLPFGVEYLVTIIDLFVPTSMFM
jgi:hypothetical protein